MKALTICQPYAALICLPESDPLHKRVENRSWPTSYRGPLAIHAGKSREWFEIDDDPNVDARYGLRISDLPFGAIVAVANLVYCFEMDAAGPWGVRTIPNHAIRARPWLADHPHVEGPYCWVLADVRPLVTPVPWQGKQGFFEIPDDVIAGALA